MLDQRRAVEKGYITLKEAAKIANYSPDYVGQLIRGGKIRGEQVYASTAWVTTTDEVLAYMDNKQRDVSKTSWSLRNIVTLKLSSSVPLYFFIALCTIFILLMQYILYTSIFLSTADISDTISQDINQEMTIAQLE